MLVFEHLDVGDGGMYAGQSADRDGKYRLVHYGPVDIPNHSRRRNGSSESLTEREALRSGWSAVRNRSSFLVGARVFESCFGGEPVMDSALEFRIDRDASRTILVQPACDGEPNLDIYLLAWGTIALVMY